MSVLYGFVFLIIIVLFFFIVSILPNIINIYLSVRAVSLLKRRFKIKKKYYLVIIFLPVSILLTINIRLPSIIYDLGLSVIDPNIYRIEDPTLIQKGATITYKTNIPKIRVRRNYFETVHQSSSSGEILCQGNPWLESEMLDMWFIENGFILSKEDNHPVKIDVNIKQSKTHEIVEVKIYYHNKLKSYLRQQYRIQFPGESFDNKLVCYTRFFLQNNYVNDILGGKLFPDDKRPYRSKFDWLNSDLINKFLNESVSIQTPETD